MTVYVDGDDMEGLGDQLTDAVTDLHQGDTQDDDGQATVLPGATDAVADIIVTTDDNTTSALPVTETPDTVTHGSLTNTVSISSSDPYPVRLLPAMASRTSTHLGVEPTVTTSDYVCVSTEPSFSPGNTYLLWSGQQLDIPCYNGDVWVRTDIVGPIKVTGMAVYS